MAPTDSVRYGARVHQSAGFLRTERVLTHMTTTAPKKQHRFDLSESPAYIGRALAALVADRRMLQKTEIDGRFIPRLDPNAPQQDYPV